MLNKSFYTSILLLLFAPATFAGANKLAWCDGCDINAMKSRAQAAAVGSADTVWVGDITTRTVHQMRVAYVADNPKTCDRDANYCGHFEVYDQPVTAEIQNAFNAAVAFYYNGTPGWGKVHYFQIVNPKNGLNSYEQLNSIRASSSQVWREIVQNEPVATPVLNYDQPGVNVYDIANQTPAQNTLLDWANNNFRTQFSDNLSFMESVASAFKVLDSSKLPQDAYVIKFTDGSKVTINRDTSTQVAKGKVDKNSLRDSHNNTVPVTYLAAAGDQVAEYRFDGPGNPDDYNRMLNQLNWLGIKINVVHGGNIHCGSATANGITTVTCITY